MRFCHWPGSGTQSSQKPGSPGRGGEVGYHFFYIGQKGQGVHFLSQAGYRAPAFGTKVETAVRDWSNGSDEDDHNLPVQMQAIRKKRAFVKILTS